MQFTSFLQEFNRVATIAAHASLQASLVRQFNQAAAAARGAWPEKLENLLVLVMPPAVGMGVSVNAEKCLTKNTVVVQQAVSYATDFLKKNSSTVGFANRDHFRDDEVCIPVVALKDCAGIEAPRNIKEMNALHTFDHEIGHLVVKGGFPDFKSERHLAECAADAYALLRHVQRFGLQSGFFEYYNRAGKVVLGLSPIHYTSIVNEKVKQIAEGRDISRLSLRETAELAGQIALVYVLHPRQLDKIADAFISVAELYRQHITEGTNTDAAWSFVYKGILDVMKEHRHDPDIFSAGKRFFNTSGHKEAIVHLARTDSTCKEVCDMLGFPVTFRQRVAHMLGVQR